MSTPYGVPLIIRGKIIEGDELTFGGRRGEYRSPHRTSASTRQNLRYARRR
jgi:hypothetical protein